MKPHQRTKVAQRVRNPADWAERLDDLILPSCHPWQLDVLHDISRRITMLCGRGAAKTTTKMFMAIRCAARVRSGRIVYCASSRPMAEELMWAPLKDMCERLGLITGKDVDFHESKLRWTFLPTGATLRLVGVDDKGEVDKLRGQPFDLVLLDEASIYGPELLNNFVFRVIAPRLGDRLGTLVLGGTPGHVMRGAFYDATRPGGHHVPFRDLDKPENAAWIGWVSHSWELADVVALPDAKAKYPALCNLYADHLAEKERNGWSDDNPIWLREYRGQWAEDNTEKVYAYRPHKDGKPFNEWDPLDYVAGTQWKCGIAELKKAIAALPSQFKDWRFAYAGDEGYSDPFALNVFAFAPDDPERNIWHVFSFESTAAERVMHARPLAEMLIGEALDARKPTGMYGVTGWPDVAIMDSDRGLLEALGRERGVQFKKAEKKNDYKHGAIELVNGDFIDGRLHIMKGSPLAVQLGELQWKEDQFGNLREDKAQANHSTDCLVYARKEIAEMFLSGAVGPPPSAPTAASSDIPAMFPERRRPQGEYGDIVGEDDFDRMVDGDGSGNYW